MRLATLTSVLDVLYRLSGRKPMETLSSKAMDFRRSRELLACSTKALFGDADPDSGAHIMVTMPSEAAENADLVSALVASGMDCMRVNCAHDTTTAWQKMIDNLHTACADQGRCCRVFMDLAGPKLRTGPIAAGPAVVKWRPHRDTLGRVLMPARIWLHDEGGDSAPSQQFDAGVPVAGGWLSISQTG